MTKPTQKTVANHSKSKPAPKRAWKRPRKPLPAAPPATIDMTLSPQEELFVELYFQFNFNAPLAYERAGYSAKAARVQAYNKINQIHIQAAIARRREVLRAHARATRDEKLTILEGIMRNERLHPSNRMMAIQLHTKLCGDELPGGMAPPGVEDEITIGALRQLSLPQLIERVNNGTVFTVRAKVIDVPRQLPAPEAKK